MSLPPLLSFTPAFFPRIWGGTRLHDMLGMNVPAGERIGEAWLISDHPQCESVVAKGPLTGATLRELVRDHGDEILGKAKPTHMGRFPLLLKLIDAGDLLSVQVHPDDAAAERLGEPDAGKTEMWHVLHAEPGAEIICGMRPGVDRAAFEAAIAAGQTLDCLQHHVVAAGATAFVPAGTVHAIGAGLLIAEIQQNSDITYRIYDYDRVDSTGRLRELHIAKSLEVIQCDRSPTVLAPGDAREPLVRCAYFEARRVSVAETGTALPGNGALQIVQCAAGYVSVCAGSAEVTLAPGEAVLMPASAPIARLTGAGAALHYTVPISAK